MQSQDFRAITVQLQMTCFGGVFYVLSVLMWAYLLEGRMRDEAQQQSSQAKKTQLWLSPSFPLWLSLTLSPSLCNSPTLGLSLASSICLALYTQIQTVKTVADNMQDSLIVCCRMKC